MVFSLKHRVEIMILNIQKLINKIGFSVMLHQSITVNLNLVFKG